MTSVGVGVLSPEGLYSFKLREPTYELISSGGWVGVSDYTC